MGWVYLVIAVLCVLPIAYGVAQVLEANLDGFYYGPAAVAGLIGGALWPLVLVLAGIVFGVKALERMRHGSRLQITWRNK